MYSREFIDTIPVVTKTLMCVFFGHYIHVILHNLHDENLCLALMVGFSSVPVTVTFFKVTATLEMESAELFSLCRFVSDQVQNV